MMMMKLILNLLLVMHLAMAHSLPTKQEMIGDNATVVRREAGSDSFLNREAQEAQLQAELAALSIPSPLKDLYIRFSGVEGISNDEGNTIQSYENEAKGASCGYYEFDVREDTIDGELVRAELYLFQQVIMDGHYNVDIYYLLNESSQQPPLQLNFKHIDSTPGWKTFDITPIVFSWKLGLAIPGLHIRLTKGKKMLPCEGFFAQGEQDPMNTEPLLIVFTNDYDSMFLKRMLKEKRRPLRKSYSTTQSQERDRSARNAQNVACHLTSLPVTKDTLSTDNVEVLLPNTFDAKKCEGHCTKLNLSPPLQPDHAHILSIHYKNTMDLADIPSRSCVPAGYRGLSMMFFSNNRRIIKRDLKVIATRCDCL